MARSAQAQYNPGDVLWSFNFPGVVASSPTVAADGTVYIYSYPGLWAITNNGVLASNRWVFTNAAVGGVPALGSDGTIYAPGSDGLCAISPQGVLRWKAAVATPLSAPAVANDGTIYAFGSGYVYAFSPSGTLRWQTAVDSTNNSGAGLSPVLGIDGTIFCGSSAPATLSALRPDGGRMWSARLDPGANTGESPAIGRDGTVYLSVAESLEAFDPAGAPLWTNGLGTSAFVSGNPVVGSDGTIYCSGFVGRGVTAVSPAGQTKWQYLGYPYRDETPVLTPAIDSAGNIYHSTGAALISLAPDGTTNWVVGSIYNKGSMVSPTIGPNGTIYAAVYNTLYAYYNTNKPADAPWPMYRQNPRHSGKVEKPALDQPKKRADGTFQFQMYGELNRPFEIQGTSDLTTWTSVTSFVATSVPMEVSDVAATNFRARIYRAIQH